MKWEEAKLKADDPTWADLELRPTGKIETKEQYDYVMYYGNHTPIDVDERYMKPFEESKVVVQRRILYQREKIFFGTAKVIILYITRFIPIFQRKQVEWVRKMDKSAEH